MGEEGTMSRRKARLAGALAAAAFASTLAFLTAARSADVKDPRPHCCFTNPRYVGTCEVEPSPDETCAAILEYLNNPQSQGKAYCGSTSIRGGWKSVPCEPKMQED
jgi:hypothetical protein